MYSHLVVSREPTMYDVASYRRVQTMSILMSSVTACKKPETV